MPSMRKPPVRGPKQRVAASNKTNARSRRTKTESSSDRAFEAKNRAFHTIARMRHDGLSLGAASREEGKSVWGGGSGGAQWGDVALLLWPKLLYTAFASALLILPWSAQFILATDATPVAHVYRCTHSPAPTAMAHSRAPRR